MSAGRARTAIPILVVLALAAILGWYGFGRDAVRPVPPEPARTAERSANGSAPDVGTPAPASAASMPPAIVVRPGPEVAARPAEAGVPPPDPVGGGAVTPSFDIVRVEPTGESVIAGRAAPGATVELLRDGRPIATTKADGAGQFAFVPPTLPAGTHEITLRALRPDGGETVTSVQGVTVVVPNTPNERPLVTVTAPGQPTAILSRPDEVASAPTAPTPAAAGPSPAAAPPPPGTAPGSSGIRAGASREVRIASVEAQGSGRLQVAGEAVPGATVRLYLNDAFVAPGAVGPDGRLSFTVERGIRPGDYRVRLDQIDPATRAVRSRAEIAFNVPPAPPADTAAIAAPTGSPPAGAAPAPSIGREAGPSPASPSSLPFPATSPPATSSPALPPRTAPARQPATVVAAADPAAVIVPELNTAIVSRGDNLWRISKRIYGEGLRYTVIFGANTPQIRNPDLIYPGQVFVLPSGPEPARP